MGKEGLGTCFNVYQKVVQEYGITSRWNMCNADDSENPIGALELI